MQTYNFINFLKSIAFLFFFTFLQQAGFAQANYSILITEIFADPTPSHGLPEKEFLELYNNSGNIIDLASYTLFYNDSEVSFPSVKIEPEAYLIVCRFNNVSFLESYGKTVGLSKFSLLNGGTTLRLENPKGELVHEVTYSEDWYAAERDQGYSLEMIDLSTPCRDGGNWTSSSSEVGGTPGMVNASAQVLNDLEGPTLVSYDTQDNTTYEFVFSEKLSANSETLDVTSLDLAIEEVYFSNSDKLTIFIRLENTLPENGLFEITFNSIADCSGNLAVPIKVSIGNLPSPKIGDLLLSEILFNPKSGGDDFVELYNASKESLSLKGIGLTKGDDEIVLLSKDNTIIEPNSFLCFTKDKNELIRFYSNAEIDNIIEVAKLPAYNNDHGLVVLVSNEGLELDSFEYDEAMHHSSLDDVDGISLERKSFEAGFNDWQSVSSSENYATPGYKEWNYSENQVFEIIVQKEGFSPNDDGVNDDLPMSFKVNAPGNMDASIYDINGRKIIQLTSNQYVTNALELSWNGNSASNEPMPIGYYILLAELRTATIVYRQKQKILLGIR